MINLDVASPAWLSMALIYGVGIAFAVPAALIILADLARCCSAGPGPRS